MITLFRSETRFALNQIKEQLIKHIESLPSKFSMIGELPAILRLEFNIEEISILSWLNNQPVKVKMYWSDREKSFEMGGVLSADILKADGTQTASEIIALIEDNLFEDNPRLRYWGALSFNDRIEGWEIFGPGLFMVPRFEIYQEKDDFIFAFNIKCADINEETIKTILDQVKNLNFDTETSYKRPAPKMVNRLDQPDKREWCDGVKEALKMIKGGELQKIVLARRATFDFDRNINPMALIKYLKDMTPNCYHFCLQLDHHQAFLGASPECLFKKTDDRLESEALAGTMQRGTSREIDENISRNLLESPKHLKEHKFVVDEIEKVLKPMCENFQKDAQAKIIKLNEGQHLVTKFSANLKKNISCNDLIHKLHPTPALGGLPKGKAMQAIKSLETFARGWYAAPIGFIGYGQAEFAVGIRSGLVKDNKLSLFTGAGIIEESDPLKEWEEIEHKIGSWIKVFNL